MNRTKFEHDMKYFMLTPFNIIIFVGGCVTLGAAGNVIGGAIFGALYGLGAVIYAIIQNRRG